jgi:hypothetical protein
LLSCSLGEPSAYAENEYNSLLQVAAARKRVQLVTS